MGGFGNWVGATMGGEADGPADNLEPSLTGVVDSKGGHLHDVAPPAPDSSIPKGTVPGNFAQIPGLTSDNSAYEKIRHDIGTAANPGPINWENWTFTNLRAEMEALKNGIPHVNALANSWTSDGDNLQKRSQDFKTNVTSTLSGQWSGASADAAAAATQHITKTSIYDFTPSSDAISARLKALSHAFASIVSRFPSDANAQLIDSGNFNEQGLNKAIAAFNSEYHLDGSGYLRNNSDGYVAASQAVQQMNQINLSIKDYQLAVQLFRDTYNPTAAAVTDNFPNLPTPPDMTFAKPGGPGTGPGRGPGTGPGVGPGLGGGGGGLGGGPSMP